MTELEESVSQNHIELVETIISRVDSIYKQLCEYEQSIDSSTMEDYGDSQTKIMDLLESLNIIQEAAQLIRPHNLDLRCKQQAIEEQIKCLEQSVDLLKLECGEPDKSNQMQE